VISGLFGLFAFDFNLVSYVLDVSFMVLYFRFDAYSCVVVCVVAFGFCFVIVRFWFLFLCGFVSVVVLVIIVWCLDCVCFCLIVRVGCLFDCDG